MERKVGGKVRVEVINQQSEATLYNKAFFKKVFRKKKKKTKAKK